MKKLMTAMASVLLLAGCNTVAISQPGSLVGVDVKGADGRADRVITIGNDCYFLLWTLPLISGNMTDWDSKGNCLENSVKIFSNEITQQKLQDMLFRYADMLGCDVTDVIYRCDDDAEINIVQCQSASVSGVLVPRK